MSESCCQVEYLFLDANVRSQVGDENTISWSCSNESDRHQRGKGGVPLREEEGGAKGLNVSSAGGWGES